MQIKNAQYVKHFIEKTNCGIECEIDGVVMDVPLDPNNRHYAEIMKQVEEGKLKVKDAE
tara:strand:- start:404 stop:580 length:177 start_codon:yes stop_codon:yes gene_type:complete